MSSQWYLLLYCMLILRTKRASDSKITEFCPPHQAPRVARGPPLLLHPCGCLREALRGTQLVDEVQALQSITGDSITHALSCRGLDVL